MSKFSPELKPLFAYWYLANKINKLGSDISSTDVI